MSHRKPPFFILCFAKPAASESQRASRSLRCSLSTAAPPRCWHAPVPAAALPGPALLHPTFHCLDLSSSGVSQGTSLLI